MLFRREWPASPVRTRRAQPKAQGGGELSYHWDLLPSALRGAEIIGEKKRPLHLRGEAVYPHSFAG